MMNIQNNDGELTRHDGELRVVKTRTHDGEKKNETTMMKTRKTMIKARNYKITMLKTQSHSGENTKSR